MRRTDKPIIIGASVLCPCFVLPYTRIKKRSFPQALSGHLRREQRTSTRMKPLKACGNDVCYYFKGELSKP